MLKIAVGNKKYSSWSLRGWLALKLTGAPYEEVVVPLDMPDTAQNLRKYSPAGRVPALIDGKVTVWDSLAIGEYLHEKFPQAGLWPADAATQAEVDRIVEIWNDCLGASGGPYLFGARPCIADVFYAPVV